MHVPSTTQDLGTLTGPLLIFGGAYSNFQALVALKAEADRLGIPPQNIICTGDTPGYCADPEATLDLVEAWGIHAIAGNVETNLVNGTDDCGCGFGDGSRCDMFAKLWYTYAAKNVSPRNIQYMAALPDFLRFTYAGKQVVVLHGSPRNQSEFVWASTDAELKRQFCADVDAEVLVGGHCGLPFLEELGLPASIALSPGPSPGERGETSSVVEIGQRTDVYWELPKDQARTVLGYAKEMRKNSTKAEALLWNELRAKKTGHKIVRQKPMGGAIPDFVCLQKRVIIEVDGGYHQEPEVIWSDEVRTGKFADVGYEVLRFANEEIIRSPALVAKTIKGILDEATPRPYPFPSENYRPTNQFTGSSPPPLPSRIIPPLDVTSSLSPGEGPGERATQQNSLIYLNPGVIGMPANDATPRTWYTLLDDKNNLKITFHPLTYDHRAAKARMLDDRRLPVSYAATLTTGIWDNTEIMPAAEANREGIPIVASDLNLTVTDSQSPANPAPATAPTTVNNGATKKQQTPMKELKETNKYTDPKDLKSFGKIVEWQEDMGNKFFDWYSGVTEGDTALTEREKALIALAVSHAIQCSYCIDAYTTNSLQAGADEEQMMEAVHVAAAVKAGTTLIYARQMQRQVEKVLM